MQTHDDAVERAADIASIRLLPALLGAAVQGLDDARLDTPYRDGGWTVRQVVHHLADAHMHAFLRMKLMLAAHHPTLTPYDQDVWAAMDDGRNGPVAQSLAILEGLHGRWAGLLGNLAGEAWQRTGLHPERGAVTVRSLLRTYAAHGERHVAQITGLRRARGW